MLRTSCLALLIAAISPLQAADAQRGAMVAFDEKCLECHTDLGGAPRSSVEARTAPDLGSLLTSSYTPASLAAALWNHTPKMWDQMSARLISRPNPTENDWADLFAYLYARQFPPKEGDAARGKDVFENKRCIACHEGKVAPGRTVAEWRDIEHPVVFAWEMWNHISSMQVASIEARKTWPELTGKDIVDLTAYAQKVQNLPDNFEFALPDPSEGEAAYGRQCRTCHFGETDLAKMLRNQSWADLSAGMWNHVHLMQALPEINEDGMAKILAYAWQLQYNGQPGNREQGRTVYASAGCVECHRSPADRSAISPRPGKTFTPFSMVAIGWAKGRDMHQAMEKKGLVWPRLTETDMRDILAYLNFLASEPPNASR